MHPMVRPSSHEENGWNNHGHHQHEGEDTLQPDPAAAASPTTSRRARAMSVASAQPSVETVVSKAKRAASTLWTLLHAQHCTLADACSHPGCKEAKLLHLHFKMCPAGLAFGCPTNHRGCDQGRKLLAHYKRCKSIRAKQVGQTGLRRDASSQQHVCLVCNLVARQARSVLERPKQAVANTTNHQSASSSSNAAPVRKTGSRKIISSFMLDSSNRVVEIPAALSLVSSPSKMMMPPPPPRNARQPDPTQSVRSRHSFPPPLGGRKVSPEACMEAEEETRDQKSVSFLSGGAGRGRAYSHSEGQSSQYQFQRRRSQSLGESLSTGAFAHKDCDTITEEGEAEQLQSFADMWNPAGSL